MEITQPLSIYLNPLFLLGYRLSTTVCQRPLFWVILSTWLVFLTSTLRLWCQVFLGCPLFLLAWGFQHRACLVTLDIGLQRVLLIHFHLCLLISPSTGVWLVSLQRPVLLMMFGQQIPRILLRTLLNQLHKAKISSLVYSSHFLCPSLPEFSVTH